jgi:signal transduction histidine kinase
MDQDQLTELDSTPAAQDVLRTLAPVSAIIVPLKARGKILGAMTLLSTHSARCFVDADLTLAADLADRAGLGLDNARLYGDAQRAIQLRDDFLSSASHDLKNPLTAIKGGADVLHKRASRSVEPDAQRMVEMLSRISHAATRMAGLIDQILDVAQLKAGYQLELDRVPTDLLVLANKVVRDFVADTGRAIAIQTTETELTGSWDAARMERVMTNLLNNAVKYSPMGGQIALWFARENGAGRDWAVMNVRDQGIGIPEEELPRVFDRFYRGRNVIGKIQGTGIGLAGVRQIVEQHGGRVSVTSKENEGTTVSVKIPLSA